MNNKLAPYLKILVDFFEITIICSAVFALVYFFAGQLLRVTGDSMFPTLKDQEQLIAEKFSIKTEPLKRGEVVVFKHPKDPARLIVKRVIGMPGETLLIANGFVYINDKILNERYLASDTKTYGGTVLLENNKYLIPNDEYVLLGDNRGKSSDSRDINSIKKDTIIGRAWLVYYPFDKFRFIETPEEEKFPQY